MLFILLRCTLLPMEISVDPSPCSGRLFWSRSGGQAVLGIPSLYFQALQAPQDVHCPCLDLAIGSVTPLIGQ